jgi:predicted nucleic acid-binding protein
VPPSPPVPLYFDTSTLISLAADDALWALAKQLYGGRARVPQAVVAELQRKVGDKDVGHLASRVLRDLAWLGEPIEIDTDELRQEVERIQNGIAAGRPLLHPLQHYGESAMIVLAARGGGNCFAEDYDARVAAKREGVRSMGTHKLLHVLIQGRVISGEEAFRMSEALRAENRGLDYTVDELTEGGRGLGRVGRP